MEQFPQKNNNQEKSEFNSWKKGELRDEGGELERVFKNFYGVELQGSQELINYLIGIYSSAEAIELNNELWSQLGNSDSYYFNTDDWQNMGNKMESHNRDWHRIKKGYENGDDIPMPIVARFPDGILHLVSGNTRLSVARVMNIIPSVIILDFPIENFIY